MRHASLISASPPASAPPFFLQSPTVHPNCSFLFRGTNSRASAREVPGAARSAQPLTPAIHYPCPSDSSLPLFSKKMGGHRTRSASGAVAGGGPCSSQTTQNNPLFHSIPAFKMIHLINPSFPKLPDSAQICIESTSFASISVREQELNLVVLCPSERPARLGHIGGMSPQCLQRTPFFRAVPSHPRGCYNSSHTAWDLPLGGNAFRASPDA